MKTTSLKIKRNIFLLIFREESLVETLVETGTKRLAQEHLSYAAKEVDTPVEALLPQALCLHFIGTVGDDHDETT